VTREKRAPQMNTFLASTAVQYCSECRGQRVILAHDFGLPVLDVLAAALK